jgi:hypothetical protein
MNATRTAIAAAVVAAAVLSQGACSRDHRATPKGALPPDEATALLDKRVWLDKEPRGPRDVFHLMIFDRSHAMGVYQDRTIWKGTFEAFKYEAQKGRLDLVMPGSGKRVKTGFTVERARRGEADVKLTLEKAPMGPTVYYGYDFGGGDAEQWVAEHFPAPTE